MSQVRKNFLVYTKFASEENVFDIYPFLCFFDSISSTVAIIACICFEMVTFHGNDHIWKSLFLSHISVEELDYVDTSIHIIEHYFDFDFTHNLIGACAQPQ